MTSRSLAAKEALADGWALVRDAWRDLWLVQGLFALGAALVFLSQMGKVGPNSGALFLVGGLVALITAAPLYAALYRVEIGGKAEETLGPGGLQLGLAEARLWTLWLVRGVGFVATVLAATALAAIAFVIFRPIGLLKLGPLGSWQIAFFIAAGLWFAAFGAALYAAGRLSTASPASIDRRKLVLSEIWPTTEGRGLALAKTWLAVRLPLLALLPTVFAADWLEHGRLAFTAWPALDAALGGLVLGSVLAFVQAPLAVGAVSSFYRRSPKAEAPSLAEPVRVEFAKLSAQSLRPAPRRPLLPQRHDPTARIRAVLGEPPRVARR